MQPEDKIELVPASVILKDWEIITQDGVKYITGKAYGHPNYLAGTIILSSEIVSIESNIVKTESGRRYIIDKSVEKIEDTQEMKISDKDLKIETKRV